MRVNTQIQANLLQQPVAKANIQKAVTFTSEPKKAVEEPKTPAAKLSTLKKACILTAAAVLLAVPIFLCKLPVSKVAPLKNMQDKLIGYLKNTVKPALDNVMGRVTPGNQGLSIIR